MTKSLLTRLGVFGWGVHDETCALASLLTGDPLLMIGTHGCAKTMVASVIAHALEKSFVAYDASKVTMEEYTGMYDIEALKKGKVSYIDTPNTIWGKQFLMLDEINRAMPDSQGKWLEVVRSRTLLGTPIGANWVWSAMNPVKGYSGTNLLEPALAGRFSFFICPTTVLDMEDADREKVVRLIGADDAPALSVWRPDYQWAGKHQIAKEDKQYLQKLMLMSALKYSSLLEADKTIVKFVTQFAEILAVESQDRLVLDGRRLGLMYRAILSCRAISLAKNAFGETILPFPVTAREAVSRTIPRGITESGLNESELVHVIEGVFGLLESYFEPNGDIEKTDTIFKLFTSKDPLEIVNTLLVKDLPDLVKHRAWGTVCSENNQETPTLCYVALEMESLVPGTIPSELIDMLGNKVTSAVFDSTNKLPSLTGENFAYHQELESLLRQHDKPFERLYSLYCIGTLITAGGPRTMAEVTTVSTKINDGIEIYKSWLKKARNGSFTTNEIPH